MTSPGTPPTARRRAALWRHRDFRQLWVGDTIAQFGYQVGQVVLPLLAISALQVSPGQMGLLGAAENAAFLLVGLPAGAWVDRMRKRPLMIAMDLTRAVLLLTVPVVAWLGALTLAHLLVVALAIGVCTVFFDVGYQSYLPGLVGREHLVEGNAKLQASQTVAALAGPALGGGLTQALSAASALVATTVGYLSSALSLSRIRTGEQAPERKQTPNLRAEVAEGLRFVFGNRLLVAITACTSTANFFGGVVNASFVLFLSGVVGLSPGQIGLVIGVQALGGVLGALVAGRVGDWLGGARAIWVSTLVTSPFGLLVPLAAPGWPLVLSTFGFVVTGIGVVVYNVAQVSFRQAVCPDALLGRMNASIRFVVWGTLPLGSLAGGLIGEWAGVRTALWVGVGGTVLSALWVVCSPLRRMRDVPNAPEEVVAAG
ncbi:MFS transporter [Actinokineospora bangkokensis]|uniref:MFS transporter n=1 Tax=Actinokineospora bangkokensis TaxID=1193682 RepID=A0A1Q9LT92_9PSEU|nr:MFS transporter [Actinokineospora bangkokensis]OLR95204.1 MFS transporter [Actinokineospora bangkokensis]